MQSPTRSAESICLLCKKEKATKTNSHIFPKFVGKSIFGTGAQKRGYILRSDQAHLPPGIIQDTDKESYILCPECERYFEVLETYIASRFHNRIRDIRYTHQFPIVFSNAIMDCRKCADIDQFIFRLFIYSVIWRCSISKIPACSTFSFNIEEEEQLRGILDKCKRISQAALLSDINGLSKQFLFFPFILFTSKTFKDRTSNSILVNPSQRNPYHFVLNEYVLIFDFTLNDFFKKFVSLTNIDSSEIKVGFFTEEFWKEEVRNRTMQKLTDSSIENLKKQGEIPYAIKKESVNPQPNDHQNNSKN